MFSLNDKVREAQRESVIIRELSLFTTMVSRGFVNKAVEAITESTDP